MNVAIVSDLEGNGGAAIATSRLASALCDAGHEVTRIFAISDRGQHSWRSVQVRLDKSLLKRVLAYTQNPLDYTQRNVRKIEDALKITLDQIRPDVINLHNLHATGWQPEIAETCSQYASTVWTLHDMWSFTGRCAYNFDCGKFVLGCDEKCPTPDEYPALSPQRIQGAWKRREKILSNMNLSAITPSRWLKEKAEIGLWKHHRIDVIPNGIPITLYAPVEKSVARRALALNPSAFIILVIAQNWSDRRKGGELLKEAFSFLPSRGQRLIVIGRNSSFFQNIRFPVDSLGFIDQESKQVFAYSAADLVVHPSLADNLPNTLLESIACGTPCVGFSTGGVPEIIRAGKSGWLANEITPASLAHTIAQAMDEVNSGWRDFCRSVAEREYDSALQASRYVKLFEELP